MLDLLGRSLLDYQRGDRSDDVHVETNISEREILFRSHFFRSFSQMIPLEQLALTMAQGRVLDVGAGTGSHVLYLQEKGLDVVALDISVSAVEVAVCADLLDYKGKFDTILMLMNGIGVCQKLSKIDLYLQKLKSLLTPTGQILATSTDIIYMFDQDEDGGYIVPIAEDADYYGELTYTISYKGKKDSFPWLFLDYNTLQNAAYHNGLSCELQQEGDAFNYLAKLQIEQ